MSLPRVGAVLGLLVLLGGCEVRDSHENLNGALWVQTAAEFRVDAESRYRQAKATLNRALADPMWSAAVEQTGDTRRLTGHAVIMDLDETVLDNVAFQGELALRRTSFSPELWNVWVGMKKASAIPGAIDFINYAQSRGVTVFFVTNREAAQETATRENLAALGVALPSGMDTVLTKNEKPEWSSDKTSRRREIAAAFRILMLFGDDLGDFVAGADGSPEKRTALAAQYRDWWGERWVLLSNPLYGSWERAVYGGGSKSDLEILQIKWEKLRGFN